MLARHAILGMKSVPLIGSTISPLIPSNISIYLFFKVRRPVCRQCNPEVAVRLIDDTNPHSRQLYFSFLEMR